MSTAASVVVCALSLLGRAEHTLPSIVLLDSPPADVHPRAEAFVRPGEGTIHLITSSATFRDASRNRCRDQQAVKKLASIIAHEDWHVRNGSDEKGAYQAQLVTLLMLGVQPGTAIYAEVTRSMLRVLDGRRRALRAESMVAGAAP